ncbi:hypothetical protein EU520_00925 [Candidatus Thorarchaeota archaeon]|nr:MAG: hypothetical protein EU520_00925 [Candidatus Thorarchaeota archaeon]
MFSKRIRAATMLILALILVSGALTLQATGESESRGTTDLEGISVAVYGGSGAASHSARALISLFEWLNASVDMIAARNILNGELEDYDVLAYPGGSAMEYYSELGQEGLNITRSFVSDGGSYVGICGGATFACRYYLGFFNGSTGYAPYAGTGPYLINMTVNRQCAGPDLSNLSENITTMYWGSAYFVPREGTEIHPIASYAANGEAGMLSFKHGQGTVFMSSPHPEYEEGSDRDDTAFYDHLNDPDSEWELLRRVMTWLIDESSIPPETHPTESDMTAILILGSIGLAGIVVVIVAIIHQKR